MSEIRRAVDEYNRYRGAEAKARILSIDKEILTIEIRGSFCYTCGFYDWIEDMVYTFDEFNIESQIIEVKELEDGAIAKIKYKERR